MSLAALVEHFSTIAIRGTPGRRLDLQPVTRWARAVSGSAPLRDDAFESHFMAARQLFRVLRSQHRRNGCE